MGWLLDFFRKKEDDVEVINVNNLKDWLDLRTQEIVSGLDLDSVLKDYVNKLTDKRRFLESQLSQWDKKILFRPDKEEIEILFRGSRKLLKYLSAAEEINLENILGFNNFFEPKLKLLADAVEKSGFGKEFSFLTKEGVTKGEENLRINPLLKELLEIEGIINDFEQRISQCHLRRIGHLSEKLLSLENYSLVLKRIDGELTTLKEKSGALEEKKKEKEVMLQRIRDEPDFISEEMIETEKVEIKKQMAENNAQIFAFFSQLKPLFLEYRQFGFKGELIGLYLEDPIEAFLKDEGLSISHALQQMKSILSNGRFNFDFKEANTIIETLEHGESKLEGLQRKSKDLCRELERLEKPLKQNDFILKAEDTAYRLQHFSEQLGKLKERISFLDEKAAEITDKRNREIELFQNLVKIGFERNISISYH